MNNASDAASYVIDYFSITAEQTGGLEEPPTAATTRYYTFDDITKTGGYGNTANVTSAGALEIAYTGQYQEIQYASLPEGVDEKTLEKITIKVSGGDVSGLAIKVLVDGQQSEVVYGTDTITVTKDLSTATTVGFALMNNASNAASYVIDYFSITAEQAGGLKTPPVSVDLTVNTTPETTSEFDKRYTIKDGGLVAQSSDTVTCNATDIEKVELKFTGGAWSEIKFKLPEELVAANIKEAVFAISDESVTGLAFKLYDATGNQVGYIEKEGSGTATIKDITGNVASVAIMLHSKFVPASGDATCLFDGVLFKMNDPDMKTHDLDYAADQLELGTVTAGATCEIVDGKYVMTFASLNKGVTLKLPKIINMANCTGVRVMVSGQTGSVDYFVDLNGGEKGRKYYNPRNEDGVHNVKFDISTGGINELRIYCG
ncbi:MAG: hypothetical protein K2H12_08645, partial [Acetatifactor sp.]|nr:hypothetical protein [Acetatifactor sp.]